MLLRRAVSACTAVLSVFSSVSAIDLDVSDPKSIERAADTAIQNAMSFYIAPGQVIQPPYYWWEAGALLGVLIQRWTIFGNDSMNELIETGIQAQVGEHQNFEPEAEILELGNDDQVFWAFTVMDAAEFGFPDPPSDKPSWLGLAQAVFNRQTLQWDDTSCGGGMRWQKFFQNPGYDYKNLPTNSGYFHLSARLARYTANDTYTKYAYRMWDWIENSSFWVNSTTGLTLYDGVHIYDCGDKTKHDPGEWTYNVGQLLHGAAYMYDMEPPGAQKDLWKSRIDLLMENTDRWFYTSLGDNPQNQPPKLAANTSGSPGIIAEAACEFGQPQTCNQDQPAFKGFTTRWFSMVTRLAPWTNETIFPRLVASAEAAAKQCTGTADKQIPGTSCGRRWYQTRWDGFSGLGEQMSAATAFQSLLINNSKMPFTADKGGTSKSDPGLGNQGSGYNPGGAVYTKTITTGDKAGAGILTVMGLGFILGGGAWMVIS